MLSSAMKVVKMFQKLLIATKSNIAIMTPYEDTKAPIPSPAVNITKNRFVLLSESFRYLLEILELRIPVATAKTIIETIPSNDVKSGKNSIVSYSCDYDGTIGYQTNPPWFMQNNWYPI